MEQYDVEAARAAGLTDLQIGATMAQRLGYDFDGAIKSGVSPTDAIATMQRGPQATGVDQSMDRAKAVGSGLAGGVVSSTAGVPGDLGKVGEAARTFMTKHGMDPSLLEYASGANPIANLMVHGDQLPDTDAIMKYFGMDYAPKDRTEKHLKSVGAGVGGMFATPMKGMSATAKLALGLLSGEGGELGDEMLPGVVGRVGGSMAPFAAAAIPQARVPNVVRATKGYVDSTGEAPIRAAAAKAAEAGATMGTPMLLSQGFDNPNAISGIVRALAGSPEGQVLNRVLDRQLPIGQEKIDALVQAQSQRGVGQTEANQVLAAGDKAITRPEDVRTVMTKDQYRTAGQDKLPNEAMTATTESGKPNSYFLPKTNTDELLVKLQGEKSSLNLDQAKAGEPFDEYYKKVAALADQYPDGIPVLKLDALGREARTISTGLKANATVDPVQKQKIAGLDGVSAIINDAITSASAALEQGKNLYGRVSNAMVKPMQESAMTSMFPDAMRKEGKGDFTVFINAMNEGGPKDIKYLGENLRRADPEAFPNIVKAEFQRAADAAQQTTQGRTSQDMFNSITKDLYGPPGSVTRQNFRAKMEQVALARGQDPSEVVQGAEKLMDAFQVAARDRGTLGEVDSAAIRQGAGANVASGAMRNVNFIQPLRGVGREIQKHITGDTYTKLANALASPEGVNTLIDIARYSASDQRLKAALQDILGVKAVNEAGQ